MKKIIRSMLPRISTFLLACAVAATMTGCGNTSASEPAATAAAEVSAAAAASTAAEASTATSTESSGPYYDENATAESVVKDAAGKGKVGNWGLGNEYEVKALLTKYGQPTDYLSQAFDMDGFDDDSILLASAMTYNELGLVKNSYQGGYGYGDKVKYVDMNDEGIAMLEDNMPASIQTKPLRSYLNTVLPYPASIRRIWLPR